MICLFAYSIWIWAHLSTMTDIGTAISTNSQNGHLVCVCVSVWSVYHHHRKNLTEIVTVADINSLSD